MPARMVLKVGRGIVDHFPVRVNEWIQTYAIGGLGVVFLLNPDTFDKTPSFTEMARWADETTWAAICLNVAFWRLLALIVNGTFKAHFPYSAHLRGMAAFAACFFWGQIMLGVGVSAYAGVGSWTGFVIYSSAMMADIWNMIRSWFDIGVQKAARSS